MMSNEEFTSWIWRDKTEQDIINIIEKDKEKDIDDYDEEFKQDIIKYYTMLLTPYENEINKPVEEYTEDEIKALKDEYVHASVDKKSGFNDRCIITNKKELRKKIQQAITEEDKEILWQQRLRIKRGLE